MLTPSALCVMKSNPHFRLVVRRLLIGRLVVLLIVVGVSFAQETTVDSIDLAQLRARAEAGHAPEQIKLARALRSGARQLVNLLWLQTTQCDSSQPRLR